MTSPPSTSPPSTSPPSLSPPATPPSPTWITRWRKRAVQFVLVEHPGKIVYAILIVALAVLIGRMRSDDSTGYETTRPFLANHRIVAGDLRRRPLVQHGMDPFAKAPSDLNGRYLVNPLQTPGPVKDSDLVSEPKLDGPAGMSLVWLPSDAVAPPDLARVEPGTTVDVCSGSACGTSVAVAAQWCEPKKPETCFLGVWVAQCQREAILNAVDARNAAGTGKKALRILNVRSGAPSPPPCNVKGAAR